jgi:hypothetical protein
MAKASITSCSLLSAYADDPSQLRLRHRISSRLASPGSCTLELLALARFSNHDGQIASVEWPVTSRCLRAGL